MKKTAATRKAVTSLTALALAFLFGINSVIAFAAPAAAGPATTAIEVNGSQAPIQGYNLDGNNYFKLRDLAAAVDVGLEWDAASNTASIDTNGHYKPDPAQLITGNWAPATRARIQDLIDKNANQNRYVCFDFDNTSTIYDIGNALLAYQILWPIPGPSICSPV